MPNEAIIAVIFKLINFMAVIFVAWLVFRKYFARGVTENMLQQELNITQLQETTATLRREQRVVDERIVQDKKYAETLTKKIEHWSDCVEDRHRQETQKNELIQAAVKQKQALQKKRIQQQWLYEQVLPPALQKVEEQLTKEYASKKQQEQFISAIMQTMKHR